MTGYPVEGWDVPRGYYAPDDEAICDCCDKAFRRDQIARCIAYGIETFACDDCRGVNDE